MKTINAADKFVKSTLGVQTVEPDLTYVESPYLVKEDNLIYNALTREAVVVDSISEEIPYLIGNWFYIPKNFDASALYHLIRQRRLNIDNGPGSSLKHSYTIFTTTACNASCSYCFEKGYDVLTMSEKTASDVASYILRTRNPRRSTNIEWFGGEPLCNKKAMTIISSALNKNGVNLTSGITTNGSLLPICTDKELRDIWHVTHMQLTFDNVGSEYSKAKGLPDSSYDELIKSMERLERLNISVLVRVHYNPEVGKEACFKIVDAVSRFSNARPYTRLLYDNGGVEYYKDILEIDDRIEANGKRRFVFPSVTETNHCMADTNRVVAITPEGKLSPCGHYAYGEMMFGDIYSNQIDRGILTAWKVREKAVKPECKTCPIYPSCRKITMCPAEGKCSDGYQYYQIESIKRALRLRGNMSNGN
jgi:radical SAM protein with 4Fe4S-binding SPASM domain